MSRLPPTGTEVDLGMARFEELAALEAHLAVSVTTNPDGSPQVAVVNVGVIGDPVRGTPRIGFVSRRGAKLTNLRREPTATLVARAGWDWIAATGPVTLIGPDDPLPDVDPEQLRLLQRAIFHAAGGSHPDLSRYDEVMATERRCVVLLDPERFSTNPSGAGHQEHDT